jgi:hypothetical protein
MPFNKKYQYYVFLEISNGLVIEHNEIKYSENINYRYEMVKSFCKKILSLAVDNKIGLIELHPRSYYEITTSIRNQILGIEKIALISELIIFDCNRDDLHKPDIFIPSIFDYVNDFNSYEEDVRKSIIKSESKKSNFEKSRLAIYYLLVYNDDKSILDLNLVNKIMESFFKKYLENNGIVYIPNHEYFVNFDKKEDFVPGDINYIYNRINNNIYGLKIYFLDSVAYSRKIDLECNYGLSEYETEIWDSFRYDKIWYEETNKWNENYINSLKKITTEKPVRFFLKASFDYPINESKFYYNPL